MKNLKTVFALLFILLEVFVFAQKKTSTKSNNKNVPIPPSLTSQEINRRKIAKNPIYKILAKDETQVAFSWKLDEDTLLAKNSVYEETIEFTCTNDDCDKASIVSNSSSEDFEMKKIDLALKGKSVIYGPVSFYSTRKDFKFKANTNTLEIVDPKSKKTTIFKFIFDQTGKKIDSLQNLKTKHLYLPTYSFAGNVGI